MMPEVIAAPQTSEPTPEAIRQQLEVLVEDKIFRSSRRSVQFLRYVVEQTLSGHANSIKERTIGVEVFGRNPSYETASDHVVRTAAIDLRKRLSLYYGDISHASELRMSLIPGSYVPHFSLPQTEDVPSAGEIRPATPVTMEDLPPESSVPPSKWRIWLGIATILAAGGVRAYRLARTPTPQTTFWKPLLDSPDTVLLAVGDIPSGPPSLDLRQAGQDIPIIQRGAASNLPFADAVTFARVLSVLQSHGKRVVIRPEVSSSFSDLKEGPAVLIGAFNNEWSLRLTHQLRFSLALDAERHLIYIRDAEDPGDRSWSQVTGNTIEQQQTLRGGPAQHDYALISRVRNPQTGQVVVIIGGLYAYGTQAAGEFITDPDLMRSIAPALSRTSKNQNLQIVLETTITDETPGVPKVLKLTVE